mmetsp:Transcript_49770/g.160907  ORF Transcript_49770/g.160907 Transcript_49770/m.160907 type:complete len:434 (+) Transcript_49770:1637-2938(+)
MQGVLGVGDLGGNLLRQDPIRLQVQHARPQNGAGRLLRQRLGEALLHRGQDVGRGRGQRHPTDQPHILLLLRDDNLDDGRFLADSRGGHLRLPTPRPNVELRADGQAVLVALVVEVEVALGRRELLTRWQADGRHTGVRWVPDVEGNLVDAVHGVEAWVPIALHVVLDRIPVNLRVLHQVLGLPRERQAQALLEGLLAGTPPVLRVLAVLIRELLGAVLHGGVGDHQPRQLAQGHLLTLHSLAVVHELHAGEEAVVHTEDLGNQFDLHQAGHALELLLLANDHAAPLLVRLPEEMLHRLGAAIAPPGEVDTRIAKPLHERVQAGFVQFARGHGKHAQACRLHHADGLRLRPAADVRHLGAQVRSRGPAVKAARAPLDVNQGRDVGDGVATTATVLAHEGHHRHQWLDLPGPGGAGSVRHQLLLMELDWRAAYA